MFILFLFTPITHDKVHFKIIIIDNTYNSTSLTYIAILISDYIIQYKFYIHIRIDYQIYMIFGNVLYFTCIFHIGLYFTLRPPKDY